MVSANCAFRWRFASSFPGAAGTGLKNHHDAQPWTAAAGSAAFLRASLLDRSQQATNFNAPAGCRSPSSIKRLAPCRLIDGDHVVVAAAKGEPAQRMIAVTGSDAAGGHRSEPTPNGVEAIGDIGGGFLGMLVNPFTLTRMVLI
jgi:hypothetical protein